MNTKFLILPVISHDDSCNLYESPWPWLSKHFSHAFIHTRSRTCLLFPCSTFLRYRQTCTTPPAKPANMQVGGRRTHPLVLLSLLLSSTAKLKAKEARRSAGASITQLVIISFINVGERLDASPYALQRHWRKR